jgi:antagonist of KipI
MEPGAAEPGWALHEAPGGEAERFRAPRWMVSLRAGPAYSSHPTLRVLPGEQFLSFSEESRAAFFRSRFTVSSESNRIGCRLKGPKLVRESPREPLSEPVSVGTVQVPPSGNPIALLADGPTTGGYPKIAQILSTDLPLIAQAKPGDEIAFRETTLREAQDVYVERELEIMQIKEGIALYARGRTELSD